MNLSFSTPNGTLEKVSNILRSKGFNLDASWISECILYIQSEKISSSSSSSANVNTSSSLSNVRNNHSPVELSKLVSEYAIKSSLSDCAAYPGSFKPINTPPNAIHEKADIASPKEIMAEIVNIIEVGAAAWKMIQK